MTTFLRMPEVSQRVGLARSTLWLYVSLGKFPKPVPLSPGTVGWVESEVEEWCQERIRAARPEPVTAA